MTISPISGVSAVHNSETVQQQKGSTNKSRAAERVTDTVHLSPAAHARLEGGDTDHDGDSH